jgi:hypothetical protein
MGAAPIMLVFLRRWKFAEATLKVFLSSTFRDLVSEREAVLRALRRRRQIAIAMEDFLAGPGPPLDVALAELRSSDVVLLVLGFEAGSLLQDGSGRTYTRAEYDEATTRGRDVLVFLRVDERNEWTNRETVDEKRKALDDFKAEVGAGHTWEKFATPDALALAVVESLLAWDERGRPGARKTFSSAAEYFGQQAPQFGSPILDFSTTLVGRKDEIASLNAFLRNDERSVCVLSGRGGIGKSKLLHDWSRITNGCDIVVLKYTPQWHAESEKEIPVGPTVIIIDDAHRPEIERDIASVVQLFAARRIRQPLKLLFATRPGVASYFLRGLQRMIAESEIEELPELADLTDDQAEELAREVLGPSHSANARALAQIGGRSPLVIVAGGRLIASGNVDLTRLTTDTEFRNAVFNRFIEELRLQGPDFALDPPRPLLDLIAALGPVDVQNEQFLSGAEVFLRATRDQILRSVSALARRGILSHSEGAVRILPDVLSDFILEDSCVGAGGTSTRFADRVYEVFGSFFFKQLIQNLAELDWRVGRGEYGLGLLGGIWSRIEQTFVEAEPYVRRRLLEELIPAAVFQPERVLRLVDLARSTPAADVEPAYRRYMRDPQQYVLGVVPRLLEATAHNFPYLQRSMDILWDLTHSENPSDNSDTTASRVLKRLASYELNGWAAFNFAVLLQCIRFCNERAAFDYSFTPVDIIDQILEREGEFTEFSGSTIRFGGFGLNYAVVGLMRENAIDFLESLIAGSDDRVAVRAIHSLERLLHQYLNRAGRQSPPEEVTWQNRERLKCLDVLARRLDSPHVSLPIRSEIYDAVRSGTGFNYTEPVSEACAELLPRLERDCDLAIFDALTRREGDLPLLNRDSPADSWERQYKVLVDEAHSCLDSLDEEVRVTKLIDFVKRARAARIEVKGYGAIAHSFSNSSIFLARLTDRLVSDHESPHLINELSTTLNAMHIYAPAEFHSRARTALASGPEHYLVAASSALRVFREDATLEDAVLIRDFAEVPNTVVKRHVLYAIAYMGGNTAILPRLLDAALVIEIGTDQTLADALTDAFGPYGVPLSLLTPETATILLRKFIPFEDFDIRQGAIPRFLGRVVGRFPDQVLDLLLGRIQIEEQKRRGRDWSYRALGIDHHAISFMGVASESKQPLLERCLSALMRLQSSADTLAALFWDVDPVGDACFRAIAQRLEGAIPDEVSKIERLIDRSPRGKEYAYGQLRSVGAELPPNSQARAIIDTLCDRVDERRRLSG